MKTLILVTFIALSSVALAQNSDTLKLYDVNIGRLNQGGVVSYTLNDKACSEAKFKHIMQSKAQAREKCHPCYAQFVNENEELLSEGMFYITCPGSEKVEMEMPTETGKRVTRQSNPCRDGKWLFYENGKLVSEINYKMGEEI